MKRYLPFILGLILVGTSLLFGQDAVKLHLKWSMRRATLLTCGVLIIGGTIIYRQYKHQIDNTLNSLETFIERHPISQWWQKAQLIGYDSKIKLKRIYKIAGISSFLITLIYLWFVSAGQWVNWPQDTNYYYQLASSFEKRHNYLDAKPSPALLNSENPYSPGARQATQTPIDFSLYNGKFYLYFGPSPAVILMLFRLLFVWEFGDQYLVFAFTLGIYIFQTLLLINIWSRHFQNLPLWTIIMCIPLVGLVNPFLCMLVTARVYEAAVTAGQFFLISGLYFTFTAFDGSTFSWKRILLGSIFWAFAFGARITLLLPIGYLAFLSFLWIAGRPLFRNIFQVKPAAIALILPLLTGLILLGWYNYVRFGSVFESGLKYAISSTDLQKFSKDLFNSRNAAQNFYNYVFNAPRILQSFPFVSANGANTKPVVPFITLPEIYFGEKATGVLYSLPFAVFAILSPVLFLVKEEPDTIKRLLIGLIGTFFLIFGPLLLFFWVTMRYMADFVPCLIIISIIGFWQGYSHLNNRPFQRYLYSLMAVCFAGISILVSIALTFSINLWWAPYAN